jgi:hypothetical protein
VIRAAFRIAVVLIFVCGTAPIAWAQTLSRPPHQTDTDNVGTDIRGVLTDSLRLLVIEHSTRIAGQSKTRRELGGAFWSDYRRSVRVPRQWSDGDGWLVNYVGHPGHGAAAGFIWAQHDPRAPSHGSGFNRDYWTSRLRASAWMAAYSLQFELGPFSEASIGNVGKNPRTTGWVDHIVTPIGGFGVMVAEDALDRYLLIPLERRIGNGVVRATLRTVLNPSRAMANTASARSPWYREPGFRP